MLRAVPRKARKEKTHFHFAFFASFANFARTPLRRIANYHIKLPTAAA